MPPLQAFIDSYRQHTPKIPHDLNILFKGFQQGPELDAALSLLEGINYRAHFISDEGYDISSYLAAARALNYSFLCFLNSYSIVQDPQWLEKMYEYARDRGVGAVGATGSWQSHYSASFRWNLAGAEHPPILKFPRFVVRRVRGSLFLRPHFLPFPNYHLRTNAFLLPKEVMLQLSDVPAQTKWDALRFESGRQGLTSRIFGMKLQALVVGRDGQAYAPEHWDQSDTYRSGCQANLLVADNRTAEYMNASLETRWLMEELAWGRRISVE
jgi:hypothetical protein